MSWSGQERRKCRRDDKITQKLTILGFEGGGGVFHVKQSLKEAWFHVERCDFSAPGAMFHVEHRTRYKAQRETYLVSGECSTWNVVETTLRCRGLPKVGSWAAAHSVFHVEHRTFQSAVTVFHWSISNVLATHLRALIIFLSLGVRPWPG